MSAALSVELPTVPRLMPVAQPNAAAAGQGPGGAGFALAIAAANTPPAAAQPETPGPGTQGEDPAQGLAAPPVVVPQVVTQGQMARGLPALSPALQAADGAADSPPSAAAAPVPSPAIGVGPAQATGDDLPVLATPPHAAISGAQGNAAAADIDADFEADTGAEAAVEADSGAAAAAGDMASLPVLHHGALPTVPAQLPLATAAQGQATADGADTAADGAPTDAQMAQAPILPLAVAMGMPASRGPVQPLAAPAQPGDTGAPAPLMPAATLPEPPPAPASAAVAPGAISAGSGAQMPAAKPVLDGDGAAELTAQQPLPPQPQPHSAQQQMPAQNAAPLPTPAGPPPAPLNMARPDWAAGFVQHIGQAALPEGQTLTLTLTPERLGQLHIQIDMQDGRAQLNVVAETPEAARLFVEGQARLAEMFARNGVDLAGQTVSTASDTRAGNGAGQFGGQSGGQADGHAAGQPAGRGQAGAAGLADLAAPPDGLAALLPRSLVDVLA